ncbi:MAG: acetyl-CoA decarbonylase/synthase complex subunit delta [Desulfatiglandales bacterium]
MAFEIPKQPYSGKIGETTIGTGGRAVTIGGQDSYPFHLFEGRMANPPKIAMEVWDYDPSKEWPAAAVEPFKDVISSPEAWAKKCAEEYGADIIVLQLKSTDPNGMDRAPEEAAQVAKKVADAVNVPVVCWGTANNQKDEEVLKIISEKGQGMNVALSPVEEANHKGIGASALGYGHTIVASSPIDVNLAKQLNILLNNLGVRSDKIIIDPTTGGLGYGLEYSYSVMERIRMAALTQEDDKLQMPMISNIGNEIWKCKEAGQRLEEAPTLGDPERRAVLMETTAAVSYLLAGADVTILRHPESVRLVRTFIELMTEGGSAVEVQGIAKRLAPGEADLIALSPEPDLTIAEEAAGLKAKPAAAKPKSEVPKAPAAPAPKAEEKAAERKTEPEPRPAEEETGKKAEEEAKVKAEKEEAKKKAEAEARAEEDARKKAESEARAKAEEEAGRKAEAKAKAEEEARRKAKEKEELQALRQKRAQEKERLEADRKVAGGESRPKSAATEQLDLVEKLTMNLKRIHKRS